MTSEKKNNINKFLLREKTGGNRLEMAKQISNVYILYIYNDSTVENILFVLNTENL